MNLNDQNKQDLTLITTKEVLKKIGIGRTKLYLLMQTGNFPNPIRLSKNCLRWNRIEIDAWIQEQMDNRG